VNDVLATNTSAMSLAKIAYPSSALASTPKYPPVWIMHRQKSLNQRKNNKLLIIIIENRNSRTAKQCYNFFPDSPCAAVHDNQHLLLQPTSI